MRFLRYLALLGILLVPAAYSHAQVSVGIGVGVPAAPVYGGYAYAPPVCAYGYYSYYPYACAPYGFYGPSWFIGGAFIGAGPWYHAYYHPGFYYGRPVWGAGYAHPGYGARPYVAPHAVAGFHGAPAYHGAAPAFRSGAAPAFRGGASGGFHGGGGGGFHGGGGHR
jgi:hypothetical protein